MRTAFYFITVFLLFTSLGKATTINGRILIETNNDSSFNVKLQINTDTGTDDLGGATFVVSYDTSNLYIPSIPVEGIDYNYHNFNSGDYSIATVTRPFADKLWLNIELNIDNNGQIVNGLNGWSDIVTLKFKKISGNGNDLISWAISNPFWAVYDGNNTDMWLTGNFNNVATNLNNGQTAPEDFELTQNYPNPFNPSTKIGLNLRENGNVKLTVFNTLGEQVTELVNSYMTQGHYVVEFKASELPSGIYFYKLEIDNKFNQVKKMVLLK